MEATTELTDDACAVPRRFSPVFLRQGIRTANARMTWTELKIVEKSSETAVVSYQA